jgi:hypothetical protein
VIAGCLAEFYSWAEKTFGKTNTAPAAARAPEGSVDMGTGYDCTDLKGHTAAPSMTPAQRRCGTYLWAR